MLLELADALIPLPPPKHVVKIRDASFPLTSTASQLQVILTNPVQAVVLLDATRPLPFRVFVVNSKALLIVPLPIPSD